MNSGISSWYNASRNWHHQFPQIKENARVDVCVLGAGLTGLSTAIELAKKGYSVAILEAKSVGWGASGRSGGQILVGLANELENLSLTKKDAHIVMQTTIDAVKLVRHRIKEYAIDCDFQSGHILCAIKKRHIKELQQYDLMQQKYGYTSGVLLNRQEMGEYIDSPCYLAGLYDDFCGHLHPLNYTLGLAKVAHELGVQIFENSPVLNVKDKENLEFHCGSGTVTARYGVIAGNAYLSHLLPEIEKKIMPVDTYITATQPLSPQRAKELIPQNSSFGDINFVLNYFRLSADHRLLFGGKVSYSRLAPKNLPLAMQTEMLKVFPQLKDVRTEYTWGGSVAITMNRAPHFGRIGHKLYFAHGYSGHGMAMSSMAGYLLASAISGHAEKFDVFAKIKHRTFPGGGLLRAPLLALAMLWYRLRDWL